MCERISKLWKTLKTDVDGSGLQTGGPAGIGFKQIRQWLSNENWKITRFRLAKQQINLHVHYAFLTFFVLNGFVGRLWGETTLSCFMGQSEQQNIIPFFLKLRNSSKLELISIKTVVIWKIEREWLLRAVLLSRHSHKNGSSTLHQITCTEKQCQNHIVYFASFTLILEYR